MKTYIGKIMITLCAAILLTGLRYITSKGYTPELVSDSGIEYPISLSNRCLSLSYYSIKGIQECMI